jgi:uncharacterized membrane protein required for colicin V production
MVFWIGILIAVAFAYSAIKLGFYHAWTMLFNVVISVYLGVKLGPVIEEFIPMHNQYSTALSVLGAAVGSFVILHGISEVLLLGQFEVTFPRLINKFGSGLLGFLAGFLVWSFASVLICAAPFSQNTIVKEIGFDAKQLEETKIEPYLVWWCNFVDKIVASGDEQGGVHKVIDDLLAIPTKKIKATDVSRQEMAARTAYATGPNEPNCPNTPPSRPVPQPHTIIPP